MLPALINDAAPIKSYKMPLVERQSTPEPRSEPKRRQAVERMADLKMQQARVEALASPYNRGARPGVLALAKLFGANDMEAMVRHGCHGATWKPWCASLLHFCAQSPTDPAASA